jgi:hypothetical protein
MIGLPKVIAASLETPMGLLQLFNTFKRVHSEQRRSIRESVNFLRGFLPGMDILSFHAPCSTCPSTA